MTTHTEAVFTAPILAAVGAKLGALLEISYNIV